MGYTTDFIGSLNFSKLLTKRKLTYLNELCSNRRIKRDVSKLMEIHQGKHGYPFPKGNQGKTPLEIYGKDGEFFSRDDNDSSVINYNTPPGQSNHLADNPDGVPGLWCGWEINEDELYWDGNEKFYNYVEWLRYLIKNFFSPWKIILNGEISWVGESSDDLGKIIVTDNEIVVKIGKITYE